jgi:tetratricopeptide (TPR) repeat protein
MKPRLQAVVAVALMLLLGLGVYAAIRFVRLPAATSYWLGMLSILVGLTFLAARITLGRDHPILQRISWGSGTATKTMVRDGLFLLFAGGSLIGIYYGDRYHEAYLARMRFASAFARGIEANKARDWPAAADAFSEAVECDPENAKAHFNLGLMQGRRHNYEDAVVSFTEAIRLDPEYARAYRARGEAYRRIGDNVRAEEDLQKAATLDPHPELPPM